MTTRLSLYNDALLLCGERALASLTEEREPRRLLDQVWNSDGVNKCLSAGQWFFAMRTQMIDYDPDVEPEFGYRRAFTKPSDWVLTAGVCADEYLRVPLTRYWDEAGYWYAELDTIYVRFVSSDSNYGGDMSRWPGVFEEFVAAHFATRIVLKITNDRDKLRDLMTLRIKLKREAKNQGVMAEPTQFPAQGSWTRSRMRWLNRRDSGNSSGSLIG